MTPFEPLDQAEPEVLLDFSVIRVDIYPLVFKSIYVGFSFICNQKGLTDNPRRRQFFSWEQDLGNL